MSDSLAIRPWSTTEKIAFRFFFVYFFLYIIIQNNGAYPYWYLLMEYPNEWLQVFIPWVGKNILHLSYDITVFTNGSGDTTYDYVIVFCIFAVAALSALIWSWVDRDRTNYQKLYYWLTVAIRFYVGLMLVSYGLVKVFKLQFPSPSVYRLATSYGDSSPMGLAWTFLGFSEGYNLFMGVAEVLAVLLVFRRTMTLAAIITLATTANVMAVNYCYDVPVKLLSTHLVIMTLFLLMYNAKSLIAFFFSPKTIQLELITPPTYSRKWIRPAGIAFKVLLLGYSLGYGSYEAYKGLSEYGDDAPKPKFYGIYFADQFVLNKDTLAPLVTDTVRWRQMFIEFEGFTRVRMINDSIARYDLKIDTLRKTMEFKDRADSTDRFDFAYTMPDPAHLQLTGTHDSDSIRIFFTRVTDVKRKYRLTSRGFHWINEYPFNR